MNFGYYIDITGKKDYNKDRIQLISSTVSKYY